MGKDGQPHLAIVIADWPGDAQDAAQAVLPAAAGIFEKMQEGPGAAVHDRHFWTVNLDAGVVNAMPVECGEKMFDGGDAHLPDTESGGQARVDHMVHVRRQRGTAGNVPAVEDEAAVRRQGGNGEMNRFSGVQADSLAADPTGQGVLVRME
mgnify:CR=1 FL=1